MMMEGNGKNEQNGQSEALPGGDRMYVNNVLFELVLSIGFEHWLECASVWRSLNCFASLRLYTLGLNAS